MIEKQIDQELSNIIIYSFKSELRAITLAILTNIISINISSLQCSYTGIDCQLLSKKRHITFLLFVIQQNVHQQYFFNILNRLNYVFYKNDGYPQESCLTLVRICTNCDRVKAIIQFCHYYFQKQDTESIQRRTL